MKDNFFSVNDVFLIVTALEAIALCIMLHVLPAARKQPRMLLSLFFLLEAGALTATLVIWNPYLQTLAISQYIFAPWLLSCCLLLQWPALFLYLRSLSVELDLLRWQNIVHFVPSIVVSIVIIVYHINVIDWLPWTPLPEGKKNAVAFVWAVFKCLPIIYVLACFYTEYRLRMQLKQMYSSITSNDLLWADVVLIGFFISWLWSIVGYFVNDYWSQDVNSIIGTLNNYFAVIVINVLFIFGINNTRQLLNVVAVEPVKGADVPNIDEKIAAIEGGIHEAKLYLESQINLERFAEHIGVKARDVSMILNSHYNSNFFEFINGFRVLEAKRLLLLPECQGDTILDIIYKSGFNSQSAFHRFFKRITGMTPSEYRKQAQATQADS